MSPAVRRYLAIMVSEPADLDDAADAVEGWLGHLHDIGAEPPPVVLAMTKELAAGLREFSMLRRQDTGRKTRRRGVRV